MEPSASFRGYGRSPGAPQYQGGYGYGTGNYSAPKTVPGPPAPEEQAGEFFTWAQSRGTPLASAPTCSSWVSSRLGALQVPFRSKTYGVVSQEDARNYWAYYFLSNTGVIPYVGQIEQGPPSARVSELVQAITNYCMQQRLQQQFVVKSTIKAPGAPGDLASGSEPMSPLFVFLGGAALGALAVKMFG